MDFDNLINLDFPVADIKPNPSLFSYADTQFEILKKHIQKFERSLDDEHEVALKLTNFGHTVIMQVTDIGYENSVLMIFKGFVNDKPATLIQHVSQLNLLLTAVDKKPGHQKTPIGFQYPLK